MVLKKIQTLVVYQPSSFLLSLSILLLLVAAMDHQVIMEEMTACGSI
jgi:hypothetical protein